MRDFVTSQHCLSRVHCHLCRANSKQGKSFRLSVYGKDEFICPYGKTIAPKRTIKKIIHNNTLPIDVRGLTYDELRELALQYKGGDILVKDTDKLFNEICTNCSKGRAQLRLRLFLSSAVIRDITN